MLKDNNGSPLELRDCQNERGPFKLPKKQSIQPTISERPGCLGDIPYTVNGSPGKTSP